MSTELVKQKNVKCSERVGTEEKQVDLQADSQKGSGIEGTRDPRR